MVNPDRLGRGGEAGAGPGRTMRALEANRSGPPLRTTAAARLVAPLLRALYGDQLPIRFVFWDGSALGPDDAPGAVSVLSADVLRVTTTGGTPLGLSDHANWTEQRGCATVV
jgi:hypothetical protein